MLLLPKLSRAVLLTIALLAVGTAQAWADASLSGLAVDRALFSARAQAAGDGTVHITFHNAVEQHVVVRVVERTGRQVVVVNSGVLPASDQQFAWNGRTSTGSLAGDGAYLVSVESTAVTLRTPVRVDNTATRLRLQRRRITPPLPKPNRVGVPVRLSGAGVVRLELRGSGGRATQTFRRGAGLHRLSLDVSRMPRLFAELAHGSAAMQVRTSVVDEAGNLSTSGGWLSLTSPGATTGDDPALRREKLSWPVWGEITSYYGGRWGRTHQGIDIDTEAGVTIGAAADGVVTFAGSTGGYGALVVVDHGNGVRTAYAHQSRLAVRRRQWVQRGQKLGHVGSTGHSTGSHLHFELRVHGRQVDPLGSLTLGRRGMPASPAYF